MKSYFKDIKDRKISTQSIGPVHCEGIQGVFRNGKTTAGCVNCSHDGTNG